MKPLWITVALGLSGLLLSTLLAGAEPLGRVLMRLGMPGVAVHFLSDPGTRGSALYRSGQYTRAAQTFAKAEEPYNQGVAAAWAGDYAAALAAWDRVLSANPADTQAKANHVIVAGLFAGTEFDAIGATELESSDGPEALAPPGQGKARAAGSGDESNNPNSGFWMPELSTSGLRRVPKMFDAQFIAANGRWLTTLEDQPGIYLRARLLAEQKTRIANGTALPEPEDRQ